MAESYDLFRGDAPVQSEPWFLFYKRRLEERPGLALEPGCGTGRILIPLLQAGFPIEGLDSSAEMLAICSNKASSLGLDLALYQQYMQELEVPKRYTTILIPLGSFILIGQHHEAREALGRFYNHLVEGGQLIFSMPSPSFNFANPGSEGTWSEPVTVSTSDGATISLTSKNSSDRFEQIERSIQRYELWRGETLVRTEEHDSVTRWYGKYEMTMMLEAAGFRNICIYGNHEEEVATSESWSHVYWADR